MTLICPFTSTFSPYRCHLGCILVTKRFGHFDFGGWVHQTMGLDIWTGIKESTRPPIRARLPFDVSQRGEGAVQ